MSKDCVLLLTPACNKERMVGTQLLWNMTAVELTCHDTSIFCSYTGLMFERLVQWCGLQLPQHMNVWTSKGLLLAHTFPHPFSLTHAAWSQ